MSSITGVSSYASYLSLVRNLSNGQNNVDTLSTQMTTGKKSIDLNAYGADTQKLLDLRAEMARRDNYLQNINTASPRVAATDKVLTSLEKIATDWQASNLMPFEPGPPSVTSAFNANPDAMKTTLNVDKSSLTVGARYTVTAIPSQTGGNGTFDVTVTDGLGGKTTRAINLGTTPPNDGKGYSFTMSGGPGDGAVLNLTFDSLKAASSSNFTVSWPQADQMKERAEGAMRDIQAMLNQRFGDRFLFSGSRYATEPVTDLMATKQTSKITLNGALVNTDDYYEVTVNGQSFGYQIQPGDPKTLTFLAQTLSTQMNAASPKLPMTVSTGNGIITLVGNDPGQSFSVSSRVQNAATVQNSATLPNTQQTATATLPQVDRFSFNGANVDIGDTFEFTVTVGDPDDPYNQRYYTNHPNEPKDLPPYQTYTVSYTVSDTDYDAGTTDVAAVSDKLRAQFANLKPQPPVTIDALGSGAGISLTSNTMVDPNHPDRIQQFSTAAKVTNGSIENTISVATLPPEATPLTDIPYTNPPDLPFYDAEYLTKKQNPDAYRKSQVSIDDGLNVTYGVSADEKGFQTLVEAFRMARVAATNPGKYTEYIGKSRELMAQATDELRSIHAKVASDLSTMESTKTSHTAANATLTDRIAGIEGVDPTEVAARLATSMNTLQAAYTVAGQTKKLSLLNYLA
ncbi:flagellin [Azospirillum agricola]|uniref:flagellin n=1 Tax=Azospirillum agricola TaxID=1720247 RepID=UPI000A0F3AF1|nr:flagellin [Azospirillum agricola]SMH45353.1 flagellin N-terminal helical region [Azospirillum lipoferum]